MVPVRPQGLEFLSEQEQPTEEIKDMDLEASGTQYEVFLSFRGPDTRQAFTDTLYHAMVMAGIRVFRDDDELAVGDKIDTILVAVKNSQICVPIFSKTFAQSKWCLMEVSKMVELNKVVVPIFYDVRPADVRLKTEAYAGFMAEHENAYGKEKRQEWEDALKAITKFKGRELWYTGHAEFCKQFIEEILDKLKPIKRYNIDPLVGIDDQLEYAMKLLDLEFDGVRYISIHGMGGIGKTTLAKIIFNKLSTRFKYSSFLENIRSECSSRVDGLEYLQKKLRDSLDHTSATRSSSSRVISARFWKKRVLIILDDVDNMEQIKELIGESRSLGSGSRIIVTARSNDVLNKYATLLGELVHPLEMRPLKDDEALQLFSRYAFGKPSPPAGFFNLSKEAISFSGGLPLALTVIGSSLCTNNIEVWKDVIARLKEIPAREVKEKLKISYDALERDHQQIFLDIACFFIGIEKSNPCYMWESCKLHPTYGLSVLESKCLIKITEENLIWMHDQLRDLGRDIVREESVQHPVKRSRLWADVEASEVLMSREDKKVVEALRMHEPLVKDTLTGEHLASFQNIRFLELAGGNSEWSLKDPLGNLRWLSWHLTSASFNLSNFSLENLVILDLSLSLIDEKWHGWRQIQMAKHLKVLDLRSCHKLTCTPHFAGFRRLERLILAQCSRLAKMGRSIGNLRRLKLLDLRECNSLWSFPEELGSLGDLEEILLSTRYFTTSSFRLPECISGLKSLVSLKLGGKLGLKTIPDSIGDLKSLVELDLSYAGLSELPHSIGNLEKLKGLCLNGCRDIKELPDSIRRLTSLVRLDLSEVQLNRLPDSIGDLRELQVLIVCKCNIRVLPGFILRLKKLVELNAAYCYLLEEIPQEIEELSGLRRLNLSGAAIRSLPSTICELSLLRELNLEMCEQLQELPELPLSLTELSVPSTCSKKLHDQSKLDIISSLRITDVHDLEVIQRFPSKLKKLEWLLSETTTSPFDLSILTQLETLHLSNQPPYTNLPCLSGLRNLSVLEISDFTREDGLEGLGVRELENLKTVQIISCSHNLIDLCLSKNLRSLSIQYCGSLTKLPDLSHLKVLCDLDVSRCEWLTWILGLEKLESLQSLQIEYCSSLVGLQGLSKLKKLSKLHIYSCPEFTWIEGIDELFIRDLSITNCKQWGWGSLSIRKKLSMFLGTKDSARAETSNTPLRFNRNFRDLSKTLTVRKKRVLRRAGKMAYLAD